MNKLSKKTKIILIAVNAALLILIAVCISDVGSIGRTLRTQQASETWAGESGDTFAQVSCFFPVGDYISVDQVRTFRSGIDEDLSSAGLEQPETGSLWSDAYSGIGSITVDSDRGSADATLVGVGGNFFLFHPYELMSGSYISDDDLMQDRVVLDYDLAWELFGSSDLQGMSVTIDGVPYYVAGVIRRETDKFSVKAFGDDEPLIFMSYATASDLGAVSGISCYELVMANPIDGFVSQLVDDQIAADDAAVVENSSRYDFSNIFSIIENFGDRSIVTGGVSYPYWENAARVTEVYDARQYAIIGLLALFPVICLVWLIVLFIRSLSSKIKRTKAEAIDAWDDRYAKIDEYKKRRESKKERGGSHLRKKTKRSKTAETTSED